MKRCLATIVAVIALGLVACDDGETSGNGARKAIPTGCGLPSPVPGVESDGIPQAFIPDGAEVARVQRRGTGIIASINVPYDVNEAFGIYKDAIGELGYELLGEDNEGFEAELYLRKQDRLTAVQIRSSTCDKASVVFVNMIVPAEQPKL